MRKDKPLPNRQYCPVRMCLVKREDALPLPSRSAEHQAKKRFLNPVDLS
jgi:hypothetical protein